MIGYRKFCITCGKKLSVRKVLLRGYDEQTGAREFREEIYCAFGERSTAKRTWWQKFFCLKIHTPYEETHLGGLD